MQPFFITCETCQAKLRVGTASAIGQILACPKCQSFIQVVLPDGVSLESLNSPPPASEKAKLPQTQPAVEPLPPVLSPPIALDQITPADFSSATPPENSAVETIPQGSRLPIFIAATALLGVLVVGIFAYWKGKEQPAVQAKAETKRTDQSTPKSSIPSEGSSSESENSLQGKGDVDEKTASRETPVTTEKEDVSSLPENKNGHSLPELPSVPASGNNDSKAPLPVEEKNEPLSTSESADNQLGKDKIAPAIAPNRPSPTDQNLSETAPRTARTLRPASESNTPDSSTSTKGTSKQTNLRSKTSKRKFPTRCCKEIAA